MSSFANEPVTDFSISANRAAFQEAIRKAREAFGKTSPLIIGKERPLTEKRLLRKNPSRLTESVGETASAAPSQADMALAAACAAFPAWAARPLEERAAILRKAADGIRRRRFELAGWETLEVGKPWAEADADVAEAIDFLNYYADQILRWEEEAVVGRVPGETNIYRHEPLGPGAVISPWNFPLAIPTGMTAAALAAGNTVVLKPAEQSSLIAFHLTEILLEAGVPPGAVNFLPGVGEEVGEHLVQSPLTRWIAFTGSKAVGLKILKSAAETAGSQPRIKRVIAEMGGKNGIIVDSDADLDEAVAGVAFSAFGYQGQKCSGCSRLILLESVAARFLERLTQTVRSLPIGPADEPGTVIGPLIDEEALRRVNEAIERGRREAKLSFQAELPSGLNGCYAAPAIFTEVKPDGFLAQEEIFGPVLAVLTAKNFDEALTLANSVSYGLTGGLYSRSPSRIERAKREFQVGNLYINRKITGAVVGRQPFGGLKLSGVGTKAGGPDYLLQFMQGRTITENTQRHGFAPFEE